MPAKTRTKLFLITLGVCICAVFAYAVYATSSRRIPAQQETDILEKLCVVQDEQISENSGIVLSELNEDTIWTHNDSGHAPKLFLISQTSGKTLATVQLAESKNIDWEDISRFQAADKNYIVVADVGDNLKRRETYQLLSFREPELSELDHDSPTVADFQIDNWTKIQFKYEDGSHNCEAVSVDFANRQVILLEKVYVEHRNVPGVYILDLPKTLGDEILTARRVAEVPMKNITAMGLSPDGKRIISRTYLQGFLFEREESQTWEQAFQDNAPQTLALPIQRQGEGVCFSADGRSILCSSEFTKSPIWKVQLEDIK